MFLDLFRRRPARPRWADAALFRDLKESELAAMASFVEERSVESGQLVVREGDPARELHIVQSGRLEVLKREPATRREHPIAQVSAGELVGELGVIDELPRSASVRALERCGMLVVHFDQLRARADAEGRSDAPNRTAYQKLVLAVAQLMSSRLRAQGQAALATAQQRAAMGEFLVNILMLLCGYVILLGGLPRVSEHLPSSTSYVSIPVQLVFAVVSWQFMRTTGYPLRVFGLSFRHAFGSLLEAILFTVPFLCGITAIKWVLVAVVPAYRGAPVFENPDVLQQVTPRLVGLFAVYALSSVVQELIVRSAIQSSLEMFLVGARRRQRAILMSALLFSVTHLHMSFLFAVLAFLPGLFWGFLYSRRPNLLGVSLSHVAVGGYVFFVLGTSLSG